MTTFNDEFATGAAAYGFMEETQLTLRFNYIGNLVETWKEVKIYEFYDGIQVTLTNNETTKQVLLATDGEGDRMINKLIELMGKMTNLVMLEFGSRFAGEITEPLFTKEFRKVNTIKVGSEVDLLAFEQPNCDELVVEFVMYEGEEIPLQRDGLLSQVGKLTIEEMDGCDLIELISGELVITY